MEVCILLKRNLLFYAFKIRKMDFLVVSILLLTFRLETSFSTPLCILIWLDGVVSTAKCTLGNTDIALFINWLNLIHAYSAYYCWNTNLATGASQILYTFLILNACLWLPASCSFVFMQHVLLICFPLTFVVSNE